MNDSQNQLRPLALESDKASLIWVWDDVVAISKDQDPLVLEKVDISGCDFWDPDNQQEAQDLLIEFSDAFSKNELDLGETSLVEHKIKLKADAQLIKDWYRPIPQAMYDEGQAHVKEMLEIGSIHPSSGLWVSVVVLVRKKDGRLRFCINMRKLHEMRVNNAYSIPHTQETLECLKGVVWFTSLDLKSGYWEVWMAVASKAFMAFTINLLRFYECEHMLFGVMNAPATFQCLIETCVGKL